MSKLQQNMETIRVISTTTIQAPSHNNDDSVLSIDLTPWDLQFLRVGPIQKGLLFHHSLPTSNQIHHFKHSLSSTLPFFPPLTGRLIITQHEDNNTASSFITCNNAGVLFVHAVADNTSVSDILKSTHVPTFVRSFFPLNGVLNCEGTSQPLLAVQVTELVDGIFIACTINHVVADGKSFWLFFNSWAEISRGCVQVSKLPSLQSWFLDGINRPIRFPFKIDTEIKEQYSETLNISPERIFHFTKEKIAELKLKANTEANTKKISSLQTILTHVWRSVIRCQKLDPQEDVNFLLLIGVRPRMVPQLPEDYFGNAALIGCVTMKVGELLEEGGLGKGALEMNKMISLHSDEEIKNQYESWVKNPKLFTLDGVIGGNSLATSSSPKFNVYGNDFGWGKPVAVISGGANKKNRKITVFAGVEEGSIDIELCLPLETLEALGNDLEFMDAIEGKPKFSSVDFS